MGTNCKCGWFHTLTKSLAVVGALNWGLVGAGMLASKNWNLVNMLFGNWPTVEAVVYLLVGLSGVAVLVRMLQHCSSSK